MVRLGLVKLMTSLLILPGPTILGEKVLLTDGAIQVAILLGLPVPVNEPVAPEV